MRQYKPCLQLTIKKSPYRVGAYSIKSSSMFEADGIQCISSNHDIVISIYLSITSQSDLHELLLLNKNLKVMAKWTRQPQERDGSYLFSGNFFTTSNVYKEIPEKEIWALYADVKAFANAKSGIDYLQVYVDEEGRKLFFVDQLSREMVNSGEYQDEDNYCTLLFASEY